MSRTAHYLARRLADAATDAEALAGLVGEMPAARAEAINADTLEAPVEYLFNAYGPNRSPHCRQSAPRGAAVSEAVAPPDPGALLGSPVAAAWMCAVRGWPVFPCQGAERKRLLIAGGFHEASTDRRQIERWWRRWPCALIGLATGRRSGAVVVEVDRKNGVDGCDTLEKRIQEGRLGR